MGLGRRLLCGLGTTCHAHGMIRQLALNDPGMKGWAASDQRQKGLVLAAWRIWRAARLMGLNTRVRIEGEGLGERLNVKASCMRE